MPQGDITFSFGSNWKAYLASASEDDIDRATADIKHWIGAGSVAGRSVLDIGSGSGIHSLAFHRLGARSVHSFDQDPNSVTATRTCRSRGGDLDNWTVSEGSILDDAFVATLGRFDIVYSWGVLHHTGAMWTALDNAMRLVKPGGRLLISLYAKGPRYAADLALKRRYNAASDLGKRWMISKWVAKLMVSRFIHLQNPFAWNRRTTRGMHVYHDIVDWHGGLPYEVADEDEVLGVCREAGFVLERLQVIGEGGCSVYMFSRSGD